MTALQMPISSDIRPHSMVSHVGTFSTTPEGHPSSNFGLSASTTVQPHLGLLQPQSSPSWAATRRSRSHSETDLSFMVPQQQQQPQHLPHQEPHRLWSGSSLPGVDPQSVNHSVPSFPSFPSFQSSAASSRQNSQEDANLFNNQRESLVGPRRSSNASERERPPWTPYDELTGGASIRSDSGELPAATSSAAQFAPLTSSLGHRRAAMSEDLTQMPSSVSFFNSAPAFPTPPYQQSVSPSPGPSLQQPSQQYPFQPMSGASLFDGASSYLPANTAYPSAGSLNECPSPALSSHSDTPDLQDASQQLLSSSFGSAESSEHDFSAIPVHTASQTTMATKEAAARRRKPGTDAKYLCHCEHPFCR